MKPRDIHFIRLYERTGEYSLTEKKRRGKISIRGDGYTTIHKGRVGRE